MNILLAVTKARDIDSVQKAIEELSKHYDIFRSNYNTTNNARQIIRKTFLEDPQFKEYTHLAIWPDDLIVRVDDVRTLQSHLENGHSVVCGCCNLDIREESKGLINVSKYPVSINRNDREYRWLKEDGTDPDYNDLVSRERPIEIGFAGDPLITIPRHIVERISYWNDSKYNDFSVEAGCCSDVVANYEIHKLGYKIMCDLTVRMQHLKISDGNYPAPIMVGIKPPFCDYWRGGQYMGVYPQPPAGLHKPISS